ATNKDGETPLHWAAAKEEKIVATLINDTNSTVKAKRDITVIGQQNIKIEIQKNQQTKNNRAIWFGIKEPVKSFT
ncbi:unnamed protein product, partial [Sphagnum compactum]